MILGWVLVSSVTAVHICCGYHTCVDIPRVTFLSVAVSLTLVSCLREVLGEALWPSTSPTAILRRAQVSDNALPLYSKVRIVTIYVAFAMICVGVVHCCIKPGCTLYKAVVQQCSYFRICDAKRAGKRLLLLPTNYARISTILLH